MNRQTNLVWLDLEMTGLDPDKERIIEIATVVTDADLAVLGKGPSLVIKQSDDLLEAMDEWNTRQHGQSGLVQRVKQSTITESEAEQQTLAFIQDYVDKGISPLCGNSISLDRRFLMKYMPNLADYFHYRNLDVSTLKELARRWAPKVYQGVSKEGKHLAMDDVLDSINELNYYRQSLFLSDFQA